MELSRKVATQIALALSTALLTLLGFSLVAWSQTATGIVQQNANVRAGPGTNFAVVGRAAQGETVTILSKNVDNSWLQIGTGQWIAGFLVTVDSDAAPPVAVPSPTTTTGATANRSANLRAGPGVTYTLVGSVQANQPLVIAGKNSDGSWLQLADGAWIAAFLVNQAAPTTAAVAPATPATRTAAPPPPATGENRFVLVQKRLLDVLENGGTLDGPSVHCGLERKLTVNVLDANGIRLNGVAVQAQYGAREIYVTGSQGKGDGVAEFVLGSGQDVKVIRDAAGRPVNSDVATGLSTNPQNIPFETLIGASYCQDEATCKNFAETYGCNGHFSWNVTFQWQP